MIGLAAVFIAIAAAVEPWAFGITAKDGAIPNGNRLELALGAAIGAITFSGSVIAWGKLTGTYKFRLFQGAPVVFKGQHIVNLVLGLATIFFIVGYTLSEARIDFWMMLLLSFVLGVLIIIPIGGADMAAPRIHVDRPLAPGAEFALGATPTRHVQVLRLQPGDALTLFDGSGGQWAGAISAISRREVRVRTLHFEAVERELAQAVTLAVGMCRGSCRSGLRIHAAQPA